MHDPSLAREGNTWYAFTTDLPFLHQSTYLAIRCSPEARVWQLCGHVFDTLPGWVVRAVPGVKGLWAPEVAYFSGLYHLYYAASTFGSQRSAIGLATNTTLDPHVPGYHWVDQGEVLGSRPGDNFNAIDPGVLIDPAPSGPPDLWLTYGSFWSGIKQRRLDPLTGRLSATDTQVYPLAARPRDRNHAIEGAAMTRHNGWYYLFVSTGLCCEIPIERDTYRQVVGRSRSVHGPFRGEDASSMLQGGGTVLLASNGEWLAPGGGSVFRDEQSGETLLAVHALHRSENGALYLWIKQVDWKDGWPVLRDRPDPGRPDPGDPDPSHPNPSHPDPGHPDPSHPDAGR
jgi:arabinan endo-1,5-alpha-L-arabinosidase